MCHGVAAFKGTCFRKEDCSLIDIGTVYRVIASFTVAEKLWFIENAGLKARSTVRVPRVERNLWKAAKVSTEHHRS